MSMHFLIEGKDSNDTSGKTLSSVCCSPALSKIQLLLTDGGSGGGSGGEGEEEESEEEEVKEGTQGSAVLCALHQGGQLVAKWDVCQPWLHVPRPRLCLLRGPPPSRSHKGPV